MILPSYKIVADKRQAVVPKLPSVENALRAAVSGSAAIGGGSRLPHAMSPQIKIGISLPTLELASHGRDKRRPLDRASVAEFSCHRLMVRRTRRTPVPLPDQSGC